MTEERNRKAFARPWRKKVRKKVGGRFRSHIRLIYVTLSILIAAVLVAFGVGVFDSAGERYLHGLSDSEALALYERIPLNDPAEEIVDTDFFVRVKTSREPTEVGPGHTDLDAVRTIWGRGEEIFVGGYRLVGGSNVGVIARLGADGRWQTDVIQEMESVYWIGGNENQVIAGGQGRSGGVIARFTDDGTWQPILIPGMEDIEEIGGNGVHVFAGGSASIRDSTRFIFRLRPDGEIGRAHV